MVDNLVADSESDHQFGRTNRPAGLHFTVYRDGAVVFDQDFYYGAQLTGIPLTPSTYRAVTDLSGPPGFSQSATSHTDVTFHYDPRPTPGDALPKGDYCPDGSTDGSCQVLPVLTAHYDLATDLTGTSTAPVQRLTLDVGHLSYDGAGSHSPITCVTVAVSFDAGTHWQDVPVSGLAGTYTAFWPNPHSSAGTSPAIRITAADAAGNTLSQTVTNAYTIGGGK